MHSTLRFAALGFSVNNYSAQVPGGVLMGRHPRPHLGHEETSLGNVGAFCEVSACKGQT